MSELERCRAWIEAALEYSGGTHSFDDIVAGLVSGKMQLWPAPDACAVTEILVYPQRKILNVFLAGGKMETLVDMQKDVLSWALAQGCDALMLSGRSGWTRALAKHGWTPLHVTMIQEISSCQAAAVKAALNQPQ